MTLQARGHFDSTATDVKGHKFKGCQMCETKKKRAEQHRRHESFALMIHNKAHISTPTRAQEGPACVHYYLSHWQSRGQR